MNDWLEKKCKNIKSRVLEEPYSYGFLCSVILVFIPLFIWLIYFIGDSGFVLIKTSLKVGEALGIYGTLLTFIGTVVLSTLVFWQNIKFRKESQISQTRIEQLASDANSISKQLLNIEKNRFRPYIKIDNKTPFFAISKEAFGFSKDTLKKVKDCDIKLGGMVPFEDENHEKCVNSFYPSSILLTFGVRNIGQAVISDFTFSRLIFYDGVTGNIKSITRNLDTSILDKEEKKVSIEISSQVKISGDDEVNNKISNHYLTALKKPFRIMQIELTLSYKDIYGREYWQEYSFHMQYDLDVENTNEYIMNINEFTVEHHVGRSRYDSRLEENVE